MKKLAIGILAHVDAGKTTLCEALLYLSGAIRKRGRVDRGDAYLDTHTLEKARGITIFSKQAKFNYNNTEFTVVDTPGHVDFSAEAERALSVLDYAVLVVSGTDGVQSHTETLWKLLRRYSIPTFIFINKTDIMQRSRTELIEEIQRRLSERCIEFEPCEGTKTEYLKSEAFFENLALADEVLFEKHSEEQITDADIAAAISERRIFPCFFGSALKTDGVSDFIACLSHYSRERGFKKDFAARVYKITYDPQGTRLTHIRLTGGSLSPRTAVAYTARNGERLTEKIARIVFCSGAKFTQTERAEYGDLAAVSGLSATYPGQGLGDEDSALPPLLEPVLSYRILLPSDCDARTFLPKLKRLEDEDPTLKLDKTDNVHELQARLMGEMQIEILKKLISERFGVEISVDDGRILYRETILAPVEGVGHFEPLRHYAEVHLLLEPLPAGSGLVFASACAPNSLDSDIQRLVLAHLREKIHLGVLTGSPITDMKLTLVAGRASLHHTEGGDFRQATYRAVRQGLMCAQSILLEPFYSFRLELPRENLGRAINDIRGMGGSFSAPEEGADGESCAFCGTAPVSAMRGYTRELAAYTRGRGRLGCEFSHYGQCRNAESVIAQFAYDPERDLENTPDSVFCSHGAGVIVKWNDVRNYMHIDTGLNLTGTPRPSDSVPPESDNHRAVNPKVLSRNLNVDEKELEAIMLREFGPIKRPEYKRPAQNGDSDSKFKSSEPAEPKKKDYLIVDGYNIIFAWEGLNKLAKSDIAAARKKLMDILSNYCAYKKNEVILVFDGYKLKGNAGERFNYHSLRVAYTKENETADMFIERLIFEIGKNYSVRVATGDGMIQLASTRTGTLRMTARELEAEVENVNEKLRGIMAELKRGEAKTKLSIPPLPNGENED